MIKKKSTKRNLGALERKKKITKNIGKYNTFFLLLSFTVEANRINTLCCGSKCVKGNI